MNILLTGDIHIGRTSSRIRSSEESFNAHDTADHRAAAAWLRIVDYAIHHDIHLILISGDIIDAANKRFEARGPFEQGLNQLKQHNIQTIAVAGNHDYDVLPNLADQLEDDHFHLLGRNGQWQRHPVQHKHQTVLNIDGYSFPNTHVHQSPLTSYQLEPSDNIPTLLLLHGDLHDPNSQYAPLDQTQLESLPVNACLLGHIHKPELIQPQAADLQWILYPGSPQALDPGELGPHGIWQCTLENNNLSQPEPVQLSTVRYDRLTVDISPAETIEDIDSLIRNAATELAQTCTEVTGKPPEVLSLRVTLTGETSLTQTLQSNTAQLAADFAFNVYGIDIQLEKLINQTRPQLDLHELANPKSPIGLLAQVILELERESDPLSQAAQSLINQVEANINTVDSNSKFTPIRHDKQPDEIKQIALKQARALLAELVNQQTQHQATA